MARMQSLLTADPGGSEVTRPLEVSISLLRRIDDLMVTTSALFAQEIDVMRPDIEAYSNAAERLLRDFSQKRPAAERAAIVNRLARLRIDRMLQAQVDTVKDRIERTVRHFAYEIHRQGFDLFKLEPPKKSKRSVSAMVRAGEDEQVIADSDFGTDTRLKLIEKQSPASTMPIADLFDIVQQAGRRKPAVYLAAWTYFRHKALAMWDRVLPTFAAHLDGIMPVLLAGRSSASILASVEPAEADYREILAAAKHESAYPVQDPPEALALPFGQAMIARPYSGVARLMDSIGSFAEVASVRAIKSGVREAHTASAGQYPASEFGKAWADAVSAAVGRWSIDLQHGVFRRDLHVTLPLHRKAKKIVGGVNTNLIDASNQELACRINFVSETVGKNVETRLEATFTLGPSLGWDVLDSWLPDPEAEVPADAAIKALAEVVSAELRTYPHPVMVEAVDDGCLLLKASSEAPVRRVADADDPANIRRTRAALRQAVGWPEALAANAEALLSNTAHRLVDSWAVYEDTRAGVMYTVFALFKPDEVALSTREGADSFRAILAHVVANMRSPFDVEVSPGADMMMRAFVTVHGSAKQAKIRKHARRVLVAHPNQPNRTFEAERSWVHNGENRYRIVLDGSRVKVSEADGWHTVDLDRPAEA